MYRVFHNSLVSFPERHGYYLGTDWGEAAQAKHFVTLCAEIGTLYAPRTTNATKWHRAAPAAANSPEVLVTSW